VRRELLIAAAVLVPFAVLVGLGLRFSGGNPGRAVMELDAGAMPPRALVRETARDVDAGELPLPAEPGSADLPGWVRPELSARVHQCLADAHAGPTKVSLALLRDGGFGSVEVASQDPYLGACVTDVLQETGWQPTAAGTDAFGATSVTFR